MGHLVGGRGGGPLNARLHPREADWILGDCQASLCFCDAAHAVAV
jgi:hypothetical protein